MPSPFPGMDPFIEQQEWSDFHTNVNVEVQGRLVSQVGSRYVVRIERRVYFESKPLTDTDDLAYQRFWRGPDVSIESVPSAATRGSVAVAESRGTATILECEILGLEEHRESYLVVRERHSGEIVTIIETLSPANKAHGSDGQKEYLAKRNMVMDSPTHLVELDLLRGGRRLPMRGLPPADYYAITSQAGRRPWADVAFWSLPDPMPVIPIPLKTGDPMPLLDLQSCVNEVYRRAKYELSLDYSRRLDPPLSETESTWAKQLIASHHAGGVRSGGSGTST